jgi:DNA-binding transcriptional LysR family regulator
MDIVLLKTFLAVAAAGSFSAAAEIMCCVQSNITARVRRLEAHLGQPVFERGKGGAHLTVFGELLRTHAQDLIDRFEAAERVLLDAAGRSAPLRLGAMETTTAGRLPPILNALRQKCPTAPISLRTGPTGELLSLLWDRKIDAAFVAGPVDEGRFRSTTAFHERLVLVRPAQAASAAEAAGDTAGSLLAFRTGCSYRATAEEWLRSQGKSDTDVIEMGTLDGILGCVEAGMGFAVVPERTVSAHNGDGALSAQALPDPYSESTTHLTWRNDHVPTVAHTSLRALIEQHLAEHPA